MGAVYEAQHEELSHTVALKETFHTEDESLRRAFKREARMLANLRHPALPRVTDYFTEGDGLFLVMEFITGDDLMERLSQRQEPFSVNEVLHWADELLDVLEYLHTQEPPITHRDIKPNNIKLTGQGNCILLDFGLAKGAISEATSVVASRSVLGFTLTYAPLEQILKADPNLVEHLSLFGTEKIERALQTGTDARSDLYSLGATLYHLLTKKQPAQSPTRALALWSGRADPLLPASLVNPQVPAQVSAMLEKAMALDSESRPASAVEMRRMLTDAMRPAPVKVTAPVERVPDESLPTIISPQMDVPPTVYASDTSPTEASGQTRSDQLTPTQTQPEQSAPIKTMVVSPNLMLPASNWQREDRRSNRRFASPRVYLPLILVGGLVLFLLWKFFVGSRQSVRTGDAQTSSSPSAPTDESVLTLPGIHSYSIAFSPDGKILASGEGAAIRLWDVASGRELRSLSAPFRASKNGEHMYSVAFSPGGSMLASSDWGSDDDSLHGYYHVVRLWDVASGRELRTLTTQSGNAEGIAFSPDGRILASGDRNNVKLWDVESGRQLRELTGLSSELGYVSSLAFSPDGQTLAGGTWKDAELWDVASGRQLHLLPTKSSRTVAFSPDGKTLATGSDPGDPRLNMKLRLWDVASGTELAAFGEEVEYQLQNIAFSPDGKMLATGYLIDNDRTSIVLWDVASRQILRKLKGHTDTAITSLAFSPDGTMLASSGSDKTIKLWRVKE
jgi:WD40 repeat protein